jgi:hypothetical protein
LAFATLITALSLLLAEAGVRIYVHVTSRENLFTLDNVRGYRCSADLSHKARRYGNQVFTYSTDSQGFRITARAGSVRSGDPILLLGDSFAFGWCVNDEDSLGFLLAEATGRPVVNVSCPGYSPDTYLAWLQSDLASGAPKRPGTDAVVLICDNDFSDICLRRTRHRPKPYFERQGSEFVLRQPNIRLRDYLMDHSCLAHLSIDRLLPGDEGTNISLAEAPSLMCHILSGIEQLCRAQSMEVRFLAFRGLKVPQASEETLRSFFDLALQRGIKVEEITQEILEGAPSADQLLTVDGGHWNRRGNERVAQIIQQYLRTRHKA